MGVLGANFALANHSQIGINGKADRHPQDR
nr:MAG TPA: hypothetical protein [Caudoviricetes sp.]